MIIERKTAILCTSFHLNTSFYNKLSNIQTNILLKYIPYRFTEFITIQLFLHKCLNVQNKHRKISVLFHLILFQFPINNLIKLLYDPDFQIFRMLFCKHLMKSPENAYYFYALLEFSLKPSGIKYFINRIEDMWIELIHFYGIKPELITKDLIESALKFM